MKYESGQLGRVFILRLEDGDRIPDCIEKFSSEHGIRSAFCALLGGIGGGKLVVGPEDGDSRPVAPMLVSIPDVHEAVAFGTVFPGESGSPILHMHASLGRAGKSVTGCVRPGVEVWQIGEVVILEILGTTMSRRLDPATGFAVLSASER